MSKTNEKIKQFLVIAATIGVILINYLAGTGRINNTTPGEISDRYQTVLTPAGYAFSIWSLIYLGLIAFSVYQMLPSQTENKRFLRIRTLYIANCAANCAWIYLWHYDFIAVSILAMLFILTTLILINLNLQKVGQTAEIWTTKVPFNIYFGWITVATILNASIVLVYLGVQTSALISIILSCFLIAVAVILGIIIRRNFDFPAYALAITWALIAIAVKQYAETAILIVAISGAIILFLAAFLGKQKD